MLCRRSFAGCAALLFLLAGTGICQAQQVLVEGIPRWGLDGRVRLGKFNLLTVEFANNSDKPWRGTPRLTVLAGASTSGMPILQPDLYIEGFGRRRIQFLVFLDSADDVVLVWGRSPDEQIRLDPPSSSREPAVIQFSSEQQISAGVANLPKFYESDFPPNAAGLDSLGEVYLDHTPPWSEPQARAFRDWLSSGGTLHICQRSGVFPEFTGILNPLNEPSDRFPVGGGLVERHSTSMATAHDQRRRDVDERRMSSEFNTTSNLFYSLRAMTQPEHNWPLIYLMAVVYLLALFPGCWLLGRKRGDYRITYGALLAVVALFSYGFNTVGARGYGESTMIHTVALVHSAAEGRGLVTQWSSLFVTGGADYEITHPLEGVAYSAGEAYERVPGEITNRPAGKMQTEIPSFSARTLVHTGVLPSGALQGKLVSHEAVDRGLRQCRIEITQPSFTGGQRFLGGWIVYRDRAYQVGVTDNVVTLLGGSTPFSQVINVNDWMNDQIYARGSGNNQPQNLEVQYARLFAPLISHDLGVRESSQLDRVNLPEGRARLYLFADLPTELRASSPDIPKQEGRVVYVQDFSLDDALAVKPDQPALEN